MFGHKFYQIHWWLIIGVTVVLFRLSGDDKNYEVIDTKRPKLDIAEQML